MCLRTTEASLYCLLHIGAIFLHCLDSIIFMKIDRIDTIFV